MLLFFFNCGVFFDGEDMGEFINDGNVVFGI